MNSKCFVSVVNLILSAVVLLLISYKWDGRWISMTITGALLVASWCLSDKKIENFGYSVPNCVIAAGIGFLFAGIVTDHPSVSLIYSRLFIPWYLVWLVGGAVLTVLLVPIVSCITTSAGKLRRECPTILSLFVYRTCVVLAFVGVLLQVVFSFSGDIWLDEAWTMRFIAPQYSESIELIAADVHPPLYYLVVKGLIDAVEACGLNVVDIYVAKIGSVIPILILVVVGLTYIRCRFGKLEGAMFAALVSCSYPLIHIGVEVRMYSWALLFVTLTYLYAESIIRRESGWCWVGFVLFSLCAAYTHYFAIVAVVPAYVYLFVVTRKRPFPLLLSCGVVIVCYFPWLLIFMEQVSTVRESYWIAPVRLSTVVAWLHNILPGSFFIPVYLLLSCLVWKILRKEERSVGQWVGPCFMFIPLFVVFVGLVATVVLRPVFVARYMYPAIGCLWFGMALSYRQKYNIGIMMPVYVIVISVYGLFSFFRTEYCNLKNHEKFVSFAAKHENAIYISSHSHPYRTVSVITDCTGYLWKIPCGGLSQKVFRVSTLSNVEELQQAGEKATDVYFLSAYNENIKEFQAEVPYKCDYVGEYYIGMKCGVYRVDVK